MKCVAKLALFSSVLAICASNAQAAPVVFSSAVATFYEVQNNWAPSEMIDGIYSGINGWSIYDFSKGNGGPDPGATSSQTALLSIASPLAAGAYNLTFTLYQNWGGHQLGDFSLDYTTATSPILSSPQTPVTIQSASSIYDAGTTFSLLSPGELFVSGDYPDTATYDILATISSVSPITGIFLDVFNNPNLPNDGPGRYVNGNLVVSEFALDAQSATPLPAALPLFAAGLVAMGMLGWRRKREA